MLLDAFLEQKEKKPLQDDYFLRVCFRTKTQTHVSTKSSSCVCGYFDCFVKLLYNLVLEMKNKNFLEIVNILCEMVQIHTVLFGLYRDCF